MFITTAGRTDEQMIDKAMKTASELRINYIPRKKKSIPFLQNKENSDCIVTGKNRLELHRKGEKQPFFFHPNSAMFRIKRLIKGEPDPFADAVQLTKGMSFLDCTLGLAADSIVASWIVGETGNVTGLEGQLYLAYLVRSGLTAWDSGLVHINEAMKRIQVRNDQAYDYLTRLPNNSIDCVYFDPMFEEHILESDGIKSLGYFAIREELREEMIEEALRVSRNRVVLKDHYKSKRFERFGFYVQKRKTAKFHYGWIEK